MTEPDDDFDGDFLFHFYKASELMQIGQLEQAEKQLEKALELKPGNPKVLNLLGLVYFKLGRFQRSILIYQDLIDQYAEDATLRVNLAMVYLKNDQLKEAEYELKTAVELNPSHEKAHRTLAVVKMKLGEEEQAQEHMAVAGIDDVEAEPEPEPSVSGVSQPSSQFDGQPPQSEPAPQAAPQTEPVPVPVAAPVSIPEQAYVVPTTPFSLEDDYLVADSPGRLFTRLSTLTWVRGDLKFTAVKKRFEGESTKYPFGSGTQAMVLVEGEGQLNFSAHENGYYLHFLGDTPGYFMEGLVFAFSNVALFENGRLPSEEKHDPPIFHLRGPAQVVLVFPGRLRTREVENDKMLVDLDKLVGWSGNLAPRVVKISRPLPTALWIELSGTGEVFYMG
jgi:hypothetical protein